MHRGSRGARGWRPGRMALPDLLGRRQAEYVASCAAADHESDEGFAGGLAGMRSASLAVYGGAGAQPNIKANDHSAWLWQPSRVDIAAVNWRRTDRMLPMATVGRNRGTFFMRVPGVDEDALRHVQTVFRETCRAKSRRLRYDEVGTHALIPGSHW